MNTNNRVWVHGLVIAGVVAVCRAALADPIPPPRFDEYGMGGIRFRSPAMVLPDPTGGVPQPVLVYLLPFTPTPGDVVLTEPESGEWSDVIRFTSFDFGGRSQSALIFYSNGADGMESPADVLFQPVLLDNAVIMPELGPTFYIPHPGQPGWNPGLLYLFYSEGHAPDFPDGGLTAGLLGLGLAGLWLIKRASSA